VLGNPDFDSETLIGYEMGYRGSLSAHTYLDVAAFHNQHDKLESFGAASVVVETEPAPLHAVLAVPYANGVGGTSDGIEIAPSWTPASWWTVRGSYSYLRLDLKNRAGNTDTMSVQTYEESSPRHQSLVQSMVDLGRGWSCDQTLRHVGALPVRHVAAYTEASLALAWRRDQGFSIALAGDNLLHASHAEFGHDPGPIVNIRRSVSVTATWSGR
jgi:iron complex outermembrane receptor protein